MALTPSELERIKPCLPDHFWLDPTLTDEQVTVAFKALSPRRQDNLLVNVGLRSAEEVARQYGVTAWAVRPSAKTALNFLIRLCREVKAHKVLSAALTWDEARKRRIHPYELGLSPLIGNALVKHRFTDVGRVVDYINSVQWRADDVNFSPIRYEIRGFGVGSDQALLNRLAELGWQITEGSEGLKLLYTAPPPAEP